jgi:hypothetical protein
MLGSFSRLCNGNVRPSRIVALGTDNRVTECTSSLTPWGISQPSTHRAPLVGWDDGYAGVDSASAEGAPINIYGPGDDECKLVLSGTVTIGADIKCDTSNGTGVAATSDGDKVIAKSLEAGVSGDCVRVKPIRYDRGS